jgi:hypothetical protein
LSLESKGSSMPPLQLPPSPGKRHAKEEKPWKFHTRSIWRSCFGGRSVFVLIHNGLFSLFHSE